MPIIMQLSTCGWSELLSADTFFCHTILHTAMPLRLLIVTTVKVI